MKKLIPLLTVVLATTIFATAYLWLQLREVRTQHGELRTRMDDLQAARLAAATTPVRPAPAASPTSPAVAPAPLAATQTPPAAQQPAAAAPKEKDATSALQGIAQQMLGTAEGRELLQSQLRMMLPQQYPGIAAELGLTQAETDQLFDMLAKQQVSSTGATLNMLGGNGPQDANARQERSRIVQEQQRANQAELATLLGDKLPKYQEYQSTLPQRRQVTQLQAALSADNNALSDTQGKQLVAALAAEQAQIQLERRNAPRQAVPGPTDPQAAMERELERAAEDNRRLVDAARSHLNTQQLESYRKQLEQQQNMQRTLLRSLGSQLNPGTVNTTISITPR